MKTPMLIIATGDRVQTCFFSSRQYPCSLLNLEGAVLSIIAWQCRCRLSGMKTNLDQLKIIIDRARNQPAVRRKFAYPYNFHEILWG